MRPARIGLRFFVLVIGILALGFLAMVSWYWWQIKQGAPVTLASTGQFTSSGKSAAALATQDLQKLTSGFHPSLGNAAAPITIVEFIDFNCPNSRVAAPIMEQVMARYGSKVRLIIRDFPFEPGSDYLSFIGQCALLQNRFWPVNDYLYDHQDEFDDPLGDDQLEAIAGATELDLTRLKTCLADPNTEKAVNEDYFAGVGAGVRGTPTFFVNGRKVEGTVSFESWSKYIESFK